ncbi:MAG TPA: hypothetical protein ENN22_15255, partial [bacterium]|nr:hypothetical protein [bacterium]
MLYWILPELIFKKQIQCILSFAKAFIGVYYDSLTVETGNPEIESITTKPNEITCIIPANLFKADTLSFRFEYCLFKNADFAAIPYSDFAMQANKKNVHINAAITRTDNWFPKLKEEQIKRLPPFNLTIIAPDTYEVMASGKLKEIKMENGKKYFSYSNYDELSDRSLYFFINDNHRVEKVFEDGFKLIMLVPEDTLEGNVDYLAGLVYSSYRHYENRFGKTNLNEYKLNAFTNKDMGYSGLYNSCNAPDWLFTKPISNNELYFPCRDLIHEVSHTWWGNIVAPDASLDYWLFEGFAKFSEPQFLKTFLGDSIEILYRKRLKMMLAADVDFLPPLRFISDEIQNSSLKSAAAYYQGALFLYSLLELMGEENFWKGMKEYVKSNWGKTVDSDDFFEAMQHNTNNNIREFFYDYLDKPGFAEYSIREVLCERRDSLFVHHIEIVNTREKVLFSKYQKNSEIVKDISYLYLLTDMKKEIEIVSSYSYISNLL